MSNRTRLALAHSDAFASSLSPAESALLATVLAGLSALTVAGNALVMLSFLLDRRLRTHTNSFLLSLAASDLLIGALSMPVFSQYLLRGEWTLGSALCDLWLGQDYLCSTASCFNLLLIGTDRYLSVTRPLRYRARRTGRQVVLMIGGVWLASFLLWPPWIWTWQYIDGQRTVPDDDCYVQFLETNFYLTMVTSLLDYYLPLVILLLLYYAIWRETRKRERYLAGMDAERHCAEEAQSLPRTSRSRNRARDLLRCCFRVDRTSAEVSLGGATSVVWCSSRAAKDSTGMTLVPLHLSGDDKTGFTQDNPRSSMNGGIESDLAETSLEFVSSAELPSSHRTEALPSARVPSFRKTEFEPDDPELVPLRRKAHDRIVFTDDESCSSVKDKTENNAAHSTIKNVPLVGNSSCGDLVKRVSRKHSGGDHKAARVLTAILLAFIVTTTPYNVIVIIKNLDSTHSLVPDTVWFFFYFLFYVNSTLNPVCYALGNPNFKRTYWKILNCSLGRQGERKASSSLSPDSRSVQIGKTCTTPL